ncbi:MAG: gamma-glutamyltransferase [Phycisphaerales bacterium]
MTSRILFSGLLVNAIVSSSVAHHDDQPPAPMRVAVVSTTGPAAIRAGVRAMRDGGTAADAVLTTALAQIVLAGGSWISYAGRMTMVYYEAETGSVYAMNACYDAPLEEDDPLSIPRPGTPSGRTVLVPGFMAGVQKMHDRLGSLPFEHLFAPAIELAQEGFVLDHGMGHLIRNRENVLRRLPDTRIIFVKENGNLYKAGDLFRQPVLAETLRQVAKHGAAYMYTGAWAKHFVEVVQSEGGKITVKDLERYEVRWGQPLRTRFREYEICGMPPPNRAGSMCAMALGLLERADLRKRGNIHEFGQSLHDLIQISRVSGMITNERGRARLNELVPQADLSPNRVFSDETIDAIWRFLSSETQKTGGEENGHSSEHSDGVVAIDARGNVAAILHTINTGGWGTTGIFVDGVSIPDSAAHQQQPILAVGPGGRIPDHGPPTIVLRNGKPVLAGSATGSGNVHANWQSIYNVLEFSMSPQEAVDAPKVYGGTVQENHFDAEVVEAARSFGANLTVVERFAGNRLGFWVGLRIDPVTGEVTPGKIRMLNGIADGY